MKSSFTNFAFNQVQISTYKIQSINNKYLQSAITGTRVHSVIFVIFIKIKYFPF